MRTRTQLWLHGLGATIIGGCASAGSAFLGLAGAHSAGINVQTLNLKQLGVVMICSGLVSAFGYLKQSPLPPDGPDTQFFPNPNPPAPTVNPPQEPPAPTTKP